MKKILIMGMALLLVGCSHQTQAMIETTVSETATAADQASKEVEELTRLESEGQIVYDEVSGDIVSTPEQEKQNQDIMNVIRQDVVDGVTTGDLIDEEVDMWCDFLSDTEKAEFKSELHLLDSPEPEVIVEQTKPQSQETKSQTSSKPKETQAKTAPQPTQSTEAPQQTEPQVTEVYQEPAPTQPATHYEAGTTVKDANGDEIQIGNFDETSSLTPEQIDKINNSQWN